VCSCAPGEPVVDPALLAFLSKARAAHHAADLAEDAKDDERALAVLDELARGPVPGSGRPPPEAAEVIADTRARLADLRSRQGAFDAALADVAAGLALAVAPTHFRGHLFEVKGIVKERAIEALKAKGDAPGAERARVEAIDAFNEAIEIQNRVIDGALPSAAPAPPR
jgi:tetratricopeptide (TPR) repeat protein